MDPSDESLTDSHVIKLKPCPRCNTPIRTSLRYGNVIKQRLQDIEEVKLASHGHPSEMTETKERLLRRLNQLKTISIGKDTERDLQRLERSVNRIAKGTMAVVTENQVTLMERFYMLNQRLAEGPQAPHFSLQVVCPLLLFWKACTRYRFFLGLPVVRPESNKSFLFVRHWP